MTVHFEWDRRKASSDLRKHRVSFDEASTVFDDPLVCIFIDDEHSLDEQREIIVGHSVLNRLLVISFTERSEDHIRIISARPATPTEKQDYEENLPNK